MTYNSSNEEELIQLLIDVGVLTAKEIINIQSMQNDAILELLFNKHILQPTDKKEAKVLLDTILSTNKTQRIQAKMAFIDLITHNLHHRVKHASKCIVNCKEPLFNLLAAAIK